MQVPVLHQGYSVPRTTYARLSTTGNAHANIDDEERISPPPQVGREHRRSPERSERYRILPWWFANAAQPSSGGGTDEGASETCGSLLRSADRPGITFLGTIATCEGVVLFWGGGAEGYIYIYMCVKYR